MLMVVDVLPALLDDVLIRIHTTHCVLGCILNLRPYFGLLDVVEIEQILA